MNAKEIFQRVVLIGVLVLPALLYIIFVYGRKEVFFQTLDYVGPKNAQMTDSGWDTTYYEIPNFSLLDEDSVEFSREQLDSNIVVLSFFFATCPSICPAMNFHLNEVEKRFRAYPNFKMVSITVDPEKDSPDALKAYRESNGYNGAVWSFLTGEKDAIYDLAKSVYLNAFEDHTAEGGFLHSTSVVLVDWNGRLRSRKDDLGNIVGSYDVLDVTQLNDLKEDIKIMIAEYERDLHNAEKK